MEARGSHSPGGRKALRASDADRERTVATLRDHFGAGRLSDDELAERIAGAYVSKTLAELDGLMLDLPSPESALPATSPPRRVPVQGARNKTGRVLARSVRIHATIYVIVNVMLIAIWAASGGGYFWPIWPILGWGIGLGGHAAPLLAGVGRRRVPHELARPSTIDEVEARVRSERRSLLPASAPDGTVTIMFSDIQASTELNARLGDVRWLELLRAHHAIVRREVRKHGGFEVKVQGDGFMIALPSARRAAQCALSIQRAIQAELGDHPDGPICVRIGMHTGDAMREDDDFYGRNVALAARVAEHARAEEVLASAVVKQLAESGGDISFEDERVVQLKGFGEHIRFKTPTYADDLIRTLGADTNGGPGFHQWIARMGEPLYGYQTPNGYSDVAENWVNTGSLLERLNFGLSLASNRIPGTRVNLDAALALHFEQFAHLYPQ